VVRTRSIAIFGVVALAVGCARSGLGLADALDEGDDAGDDNGAARGGRGGSSSTGDDDDVAGSFTGGTTATGGVGGSLGGRGGAPSGGVGGMPEPPIDPGGPIPNCRADSPVTVAPKDRHWLYLEGRTSAQDPAGGYLVELTPDGPRMATRLSQEGGFRGWSADGRFLAFSRAGAPDLTEVLDFSQGALPVPVAVPSRAGIVTWSHSGGRYALEIGMSELAIVDAPSATERVIELPDASYLTVESWSPDDRYVVLVGASGLVLVDTSGEAFELHTVYDDDASGAHFSPDGRYLAFESRRTVEADRSLYLFDTQSGVLELLANEFLGAQLFFAWAGNEALVVGINGQSFVLDVSQRPHPRVPLADHRDQLTQGSLSPGDKCFVYDGYCDAAGEVGICVKTLPPDPEKPAVLIQRADGKSWEKKWAGTGDQLLLRTDSNPWLINVELDAGELTRRVIIEGTDTRDVRYALGWNPSGLANWIIYLTTPLPAGRLPPYQPRLWNRETGESVDVPIDGGNVAATAWSSDDRYLVVKTDSTSGNGAYFVQEVRDGQLGNHWRVSDVVPGVESPLWPFYLQP
jgi:Tol biopolymer transport system component